MRRQSRFQIVHFLIGEHLGTLNRLRKNAKKFNFYRRIRVLCRSKSERNSRHPPKVLAEHDLLGKVQSSFKIDFWLLVRYRLSWLVSLECILFCVISSFSRKSRRPRKCDCCSNRIGNPSRRLHEQSRWIVVVFLYQKSGG